MEWMRIPSVCRRQIELLENEYRYGETCICVFDAWHSPYKTYVYKRIQYWVDSKQLLLCVFSSTFRCFLAWVQKLQSLSLATPLLSFIYFDFLGHWRDSSIRLFWQTPLNTITKHWRIRLIPRNHLWIITSNFILIILRFPFKLFYVCVAHAIYATHDTAMLCDRNVRLIKFYTDNLCYDWYWRSALVIIRYLASRNAS